MCQSAKSTTLVRDSIDYFQGIVLATFLKLTLGSSFRSISIVSPNTYSRQIEIN